MTCGACDYWYPETPVGLPLRQDPGACHRHAPTLIAIVYREDVATGSLAQWPKTRAEQGCGDYQRHPTRRLAE